MVASNALSTLNGYSKLAISVYDAYNGLVSGLTPSTQIQNAPLRYVVQGITNIQFSYVKPWGAPDSQQRLTYITNLATVKGDVTLDYIKINNQIAYPKSKTWNYTSTHKAKGWDNYLLNAARIYANNTSQETSFVSQVTVYANGRSKRIGSYSPKAYYSMSQIY